MIAAVIRVNRTAVGLACVAALLLSGRARAETALQTELARAAGVRPTNKFKGSLLEAATYVGSGSFYTSGYRDPYASLALYARPTYDLGTPYALTLNARVYVEAELTAPDNPEARHLYVYDPWVWLAAGNLHTFETSKIRIGGLTRLILPLSPESRYQHMLFAVGAGLNVNRVFEFGNVSDPDRKWQLIATYAVIGYKFAQTSIYRGEAPGDTTNCLAPGTAHVGGAESDHCGGPHNPNFSFTNAFILNLTHGLWTASLWLQITNQFNYSFPDDPLSPAAGTNTGRTDSTWGIISLGRQLNDRLSLSAGISSNQPALDSRYRYPRFPFFDLSGGANAHNYTQFFLALDGTI